MKLVLFYFTAFFCSCFVQSAKKEIFKAAQELLEKEDKRLSDDKIKCSRQKISNNFISNLRLTDQVDQGIACVIAKLKSDSKGHLWSTLGHFYQSKPKQYYASLSTTAFKQAVKLSGKLTAVTDWSFLGPFVIGKIEIDGDPAEEFGGIRKLSRLRFQKGQRMFSELLVGGHVEWTQIKQAGSDFIQISPKVQWGLLVNALGSVGITEWQGWLVGDFLVNDKDVNVLVQCLGVHTAFVDDIPVTGDVYRRSQFWYSTGPLTRGVHTLYIRVRTKGQAAVKCNIKQMSSAFEIHNPSFLPDLVNGYLFSNYVSLPLSNQHNKKWLKNIKVAISSQEEGQPLTVKMLDKQLAIAPGQTRPVNLRLQAAKQKVMEKCEDLSMKLKVSTSEGHNIFPLTLRCRKEGESFLFTFLDHDGSVQQAAAILPIGGCLSKVCPTVLTLHGTTVPPQNQADSYKRMENGKFVFGVDGAWLLAPTRHGAHNWEGPGSLTALTALSRLSELTKEQSWIQYQASERHVVYAGHSMGGHGAWHLATHYPDRALAVVSLSGWIKKEEYGDSNLFFRHDISTSHTDPAVKSVMEACIAENDADRHVGNLQDIPVLIRVGANDQTVHPFYQRRMYRLLREHNISVTYTELDGKEHWWWDTWETNDGGTVNDKQIRDFVAQYTAIGDDVSSCSSDGECTGDASDRYKGSDAFTLTLYNPALGEGMRGVSVVQQITPFRLTQVEVVVDGDSVVLVSTNVKTLRLGTGYNRPIRWLGKNITIDHQMVKTADMEVKELVFSKSNGTWKLEQDWKMSSKERNQHTLGPARRIAVQPFLIVTGTQGDLETSATLQQLAVYIANLFYLTSDAYAPVVKDTDMTEDMLSRHNVIIIGGPSQNKYAEQFLNDVPLLYSAKSGFQLGSCLFSQPRTGALFLSPHGSDHLALVLMAHSMQGLYDVVSLASPTIPPMTRSPFSNLIPDFLITGPQYRARGPGGYLCAGFWGNSWEFRTELASCSC